MINPIPWLEIILTIVGIVLIAIFGVLAHISYRIERIEDRVREK